MLSKWSAVVSLLQAVVAGYLATGIYGVEIWQTSIPPGTTCSALLQLGLVGG